MADEPKEQNGKPEPAGPSAPGELKSLRDLVRDHPEIQAEVNHVVEDRISRERKRFQSSLEDLLKERGGNLDEILGRLRHKVASLEEATLSAEERSRRASARAVEEKDRQIEGLCAEIARWHGIHRRSVAERALSDAGSRLGAYSADQIVRLLASDIVVEEETDAESGKGIGRFRARMKRTDRGSDGQAQEILVPVEEGVERYLLENPNLRRPERTAGSGSQGAPFVPDRLTADRLGNMSISELRKRKKELEALAKGQ